MILWLLDADAVIGGDAAGSGGITNIDGGVDPDNIASNGGEGLREKVGGALYVVISSAHAKPRDGNATAAIG